MTMSNLKSRAHIFGKSSLLEQKAEATSNQEKQPPNYIILDLAVDCGMLCHPDKLTPPKQVVKYCGFLLDSRGIPCLRVPVAKRERALAIVDHLWEAPSTREFSRLSLAVAAGVLQSLVEATPLRLGNTYMRRFHSLVRPPGLGFGLAPYLTKTCISDGV